MTAKIKRKYTIFQVRITTARHESWMVALKRNPKDLIYKDACVCSDHFSPADIIKVKNKWTLRVGAIPTLKLRPSAKKNLFLYSAPSSVKLAVIPEDPLLLCSSTMEVHDNQAASSDKISNCSILSQSESQAADSEPDVNFCGKKCVWIIATINPPEN